MPTFKWLNTPGVYTSFYIYAYSIPYLNAIILSVLFTATPDLFISGTSLNSIMALLLLCMIYSYEYVYVFFTSLYLTL